jgi:hypothetical protein
MVVFMAKTKGGKTASGILAGFCSIDAVRN